MTETAKTRRLLRSLARLARTRCPRFVFGRPLSPGEIPVFIYHDVTADGLARDLDFLATNGYRTLSIGEFHARMNDGAGDRAKRGDRAVLLTFDDARRSFAETAYPLLLERGARATVFVPSHWPASDGPSPPASGDAAAFMSWQQLAECRGSGLVDVESHGDRHALVAASRRLAGFATPQALERYDLFDWPMRREAGGDVCGRPPLGTPVYESAPLLSAERRVLERPEVLHACRAWVAARGGPRFFERVGWARELRAVHDAALDRIEPRADVPVQAMATEAAAEIRRAVESFERHLGTRPRYFAYPWVAGSGFSRRLLSEAGFAAAFGTATDFGRRAQGLGQLPVYGRYKADWLRFLPGRGRARLERVLRRKLAAFLASQHLAY